MYESLPPKLLSVRALADYLGVSKTTINQYRADGTGPAYLKIGLLIRYRIADVEAWLDTLKNTSELTG
ncbi:MAG: helix-turn-helix domain-containing protein [Rickettsiales bacterium]|jgi:excisionase family DNA binding protein|nr:helix-turn-helix domain-containing protein [Rickettsiales bacterium]